MVEVMCLFLYGFIGLGVCLNCSTTSVSDIPSRVAQADVIFQGKLARILSQESTKAKWDIWKMDFTVDVIHKGEFKKPRDVRTYESDLQETLDGVPRAHIGKQNMEFNGAYVKPLLISVLITDEMRSCLPGMKTGQKYIIFLNGTITKSGDNDDLYWPSNLPELQTARKVREVKKYSCKRCVQYPKVQLSPPKLFLTKGEDIKLKCLLEGSPPPRVTWFKNNEALRSSKRLEIISRKSSSALVIRGADESDGGSYSCNAMNALGNASSLRSPVIIESKAMTLNDGIPHSTLCTEQTYCVNGGTCYELLNLGNKFCVCPPGFTGNRCQDKGPEVGIGGMENVLVIVCIFLVLLLLITTFAILYCLARFRQQFSEHEKRYYAIMERRRGTDGNVQSVDQCRKDLLESLEVLLPDKQTTDAMKPAERTSSAMQLGTTRSKMGPLNRLDSCLCHETPGKFTQSSQNSEEHFDDIVSGMSCLPETKRECGDTCAKTLSPVLQSPGQVSILEGKGTSVAEGASRNCVLGIEQEVPRLSSPGNICPGFRSDDPCLSGKGSVDSDADGRRKNEKLNVGPEGSSSATEAAIVVGREEMFYDDVNALLLELGICDVVDRNTSIKS